MAVVETTTRHFSGYIALAALFAVVFYGLHQLLVARVDPREPPVLKPRIPFVGHILGLIKHQHSYYKLLFGGSPAPICTLPMLNGKGYVITDPGLALAAFRSRNLSLGPLISEMIARITGLSDDCMDIYNSVAFQAQWNKIVHSTLTGEQLRLINIAGLRDLANALNAVPGGGLDIPDLYLWTRSTMTRATTSALYGDENPWKRDPSLTEAYWGFESYMLAIIINILPGIVAPRAITCRNQLRAGFRDYFASSGDQNPSTHSFTKQRGLLERSSGLSADDMAALEVVVVHGALSNTIPTSFWFLVHVFSCPDLVERLRKELENIVSPGDEPKEMAIDIARLEDRCPLLVSSFRESHRLSSVGTSIRRVMQDTVLSAGGRSHLLKEGCFVHVPMSVVHVARETWGADADGFRGSRFRDMAAGESVSKEKRVYFPFGGGRHACPGRHFASAESWGFLVVLLMGFDVTGPDGGVVQVPRPKLPNMTTSIWRPLAGENLEAKIWRRSGWEDVVWRISE
ncbi:25-hydroxycholesterol 7-alpha-hydroxylase [Colletotrichum spinosum]|uniref:25-hydroxycholesterol 7-alpha-hydroxylase n=1 Tax=Colletotrichum spinosum TaxID=1347390 RepID=A0A4R8QPX0_9PEZI|nr:25-hydroxycholesterol 7-alpha-hydroxylase [Colletotrichum spinosum]